MEKVELVKPRRLENRVVVQTCLESRLYRPIQLLISPTCCAFEVPDALAILDFGATLSPCGPTLATLGYRVLFVWATRLSDSS